MEQVNIVRQILSNEWTILGGISFILVVFLILIASSSSVAIGKVSKMNISKSKQTIRNQILMIIIFALVGFIFMRIGLPKALDLQKPNEVITTENQENQETVSSFKKCSTWSEGFSMCRTYDRQSTWVLIRQSDEAHIDTIRFPDKLEVIAVEPFKNGIANVIGKPKLRKVKVAEVETSGQVLIYVHE